MTTKYIMLFLSILDLYNTQKNKISPPHKKYYTFRYLRSVLIVLATAVVLFSFIQASISAYIILTQNNAFNIYNWVYTVILFASVIFLYIEFVRPDFLRKVEARDQVQTVFRDFLIGFEKEFNRQM